MNIKNLTYPKISRLKPDDPITYFNRAVITHKIDGTNGRLIWDGEELIAGSRNQVLVGGHDNYGFSKWVDNNIDIEPFKEDFINVDVVVFGEFFRDSINGRVKYGSNSRFRVFDIFINSVFLDWADVVDVAENSLGLDVVPYDYIDNPNKRKLENYIEDYNDPLAIENANSKKRIGEGIVVRPPIEMKYKKDRRVIYKVKSEKFAEVKKGTNKGSSDNDSGSRFSKKEKAKVDKYITENRIFSVVSSMGEADPTFEVSMEITGDVIKNTIEDIKEESDEEFSDQLLGKYGGGKIAQKFKKMINEGRFQ